MNIPFYRSCSQAIIALALSVPYYSAAADVTHTLSEDTSWKNNSTIVSNQGATIEAASGITPNFEISGYTQQAFFSQSNLCGSSSWSFQNLGDISVDFNNIAITNSGLSSSHPDIYQGIFRALNMNGQGFNTLQIKDSGDISFSSNSFSFASSVGYGGVITAFCQYQGGSDEYTIVSIDGNNKTVLFDSNAVMGSRAGNSTICGGGVLIGIPREGMAAMLNNHPKVAIFGCDTLRFSNNVVAAGSTSGAASASGGALYGGGYSIFDLSDNKSVQITDTSVMATAIGKATAAGGGIYGNELRVSNVQDVTISGNKVASYSENGAADSSGAGCMMETLGLTGNGSLVVKDNVATADGATSSTANGGGLSAAFTTITGNGNVEISDNGAVAKQRTEDVTSVAGGGGINSACITIADNDKVSFRGNYLTAGNETSLSAVTLVTFGGLDSYLDVSAPQEGSVTFYDPINITDVNDEPVVNFNKATEGVEGSGEGTIVFSGNHTEEDLAAIIGRTPTEAEVEESRTSSIACETLLHGGTMRIEDQAVFSAEAFSALEDSNATVEVKDGELRADTVTFARNSSLKTEGNATIVADSLIFAAGSSLTMSGMGTTINSTSITFEEGSALTLNVDMNDERMSAAAFTVISEDVLMDGAITLNLNFTKNLRAGSYRIIEGVGEEWMPDNVTTSGVVEDAGEFVVKNGVLCFILRENLLVVHDPLADAVQAANWGVFKSSQAFVGTLWGTRDNAVVLGAPVSGKRGLQASAAAQTIAWGSVYSSYTHQGGSGAFGGANYSIYGAAIGAERLYVSGRSLGVAFGYDCGKASPFATSRVNQDSWHAALYGRAGSWNVGRKGSVALDWSAAVGNTTSDCNSLGSDWSQDSLQLDVRATYSYNLNSRTAVSAFAGVQYYAQGDDSTSRVKAGSLQNLRLQAGAGISYRATDRATVYGELAIHNDTMRHNPSVRLDNMNYGSGANPGRLGGSVTVGAQYQLNGGWSLNGSYSFEGTDNSGEHNVNVGAVYSF